MPYGAHDLDTWGFHYPSLFPEEEDACSSDAAVNITERDNSTTCPRQAREPYYTLKAESSLFAQLVLSAHTIVVRRLVDAMRLEHS